MSANRMQEAFLKAAASKSAALPLFRRVAKAADKVTIRPLRDERKLSFRTFNKLKGEGILE